MANKDIALMAHLLRRACFGATREDIEAKLAKGYEHTVEELLDPKGQPRIDDDLLVRFWPAYQNRAPLEANQTMWIYYMINNPRQLQEKMSLFWHTIFCTGYSKLEHGLQIGLQIDMFREHGLGNFRDLLVQLSKDPAMIFYLDNCESHIQAVNENYGRELLELFSMGVGMDGRFNYTEDDVKACARAFTGWSIAPSLPVYPHDRLAWRFGYYPTDHDESEKTFLGQTGRWNGEDVIEIICGQPATARFIARKMYDFFVADEPPVPFWRHTEPRDMAAIKTLERAYLDSGYEIKSMLRTLFNSDFFKSEAARFAKIKSPAEVVAGTLRLVGEHVEIKPGLLEMAMETKYMGMNLMNPPTVEGWHSGREWIDSGTLMERVNFASSLLGNTELPGVKAMIDRLATLGDNMSAEELVDGCLDLMGPLDVAEATREELIKYTAKDGVLHHGTGVQRAELARRVGETFQLIAATPEYQFT